MWVIQAENDMGFISNIWERQHGRQLMLSATAFGASLILLLVSAYQLLFLQENTDWQDFTGAAIGMAVVSSILLLIIAPEFLTLKGYVSTLDELKEIDSLSELKRRRSEGDEAAKVLGAGHEESWSKFLQEKGLKKMK
ncbi:MAG: hypothetical protein HN794_06275 [Euryarchaeota archaeon]|jgi:hypothetical protein|nr:hypothetical protein [Euryarchaeota archaeon]MBT4924295.1 hypothetical protein [Euryarchaeota archaeon]MBT5736242.1 hypothetical protein [Euryarchaeota archaeon]MBT7460633.1 hypothetical protein [Euryarchaeota archaeon]